MEPSVESRPLVELRNRAVVTMALMAGIEPDHIIAARKSMGAGRPSRLRVTFYFQPSAELTTVLQNASPARIQYLERHAAALEHFRELYNRAATSRRSA